MKGAVNIFFKKTQLTEHQMMWITVCRSPRELLAPGAVLLGSGKLLQHQFIQAAAPHTRSLGVTNRSVENTFVNVVNLLTLLGMEQIRLQHK